MKPYYSDNHIRIFNKSCRSMDELPDESVQVVVTSPPYFGLRKYSGDQDEIWGGDRDCQHEWVDKIKPDDAGQGHYTGRTRWQHIAKEAQEQGIPVREVEPTAWAKGGFKTGFCSLCGAWKGSLGLEPTPELYLQHLIEVLREIKRVLRKDGVVFWNIGDSYASGKGSCFNPGGGEASLGKAKKEAGAHPLHRGNVSELRQSNLKPKDLCLIPQRLMIAAQADGWWVRSVICWEKQNPMPESVNGWRWSRHRIRIDENGNRVTKGGRLIDCPGCKLCLANDGLWLYKGSWRPTESHEYILMLTKSDTYYCDADAVREPQSVGTFERYGKDSHIPASPKWEADDIVGKRRASMTEAILPNGRNLRSVWTFPTVPFPSFKIDSKKVDHFAVFPEKLPELCIKAATPEGCCSKCGAPWARITKPVKVQGEAWSLGGNRQLVYKEEMKLSPSSMFNTNEITRHETLGWQPTCACQASKAPSLVLDPMMGAGTTLLVAKKLNRYAVGYELSQEYCTLAMERCRQQGML